MGVYATDALRRAFQAAGEDLDAFIEAFEEWQRDWPKNEHRSYLFGKEGGYVAPLVDGKKNVLRHVHLTPIKDQRALSRWVKKFKFLSRKTSDRVLVFVRCPATKNVLLISAIPEPMGHTISKDPRYAHVMKGYAGVASDFLFDGRIEV